jgi:hypothetical protein
MLILSNITFRYKDLRSFCMVVAIMDQVDHLALHSCQTTFRIDDESTSDYRSHASCAPPSTTDAISPHAQSLANL